MEDLIILKTNRNTFKKYPMFQNLMMYAEVIYPLYTHLYLTRWSRKGQFTKKMPGSDTYIFDMYIPLGIKKRPNENIRSMS